MAQSIQAPHMRVATAAIPANAGIGLRSRHYRDVLNEQPAVAWFEVHSENYFGKGGAPLRYLEAVRNDYPLSLHGVGMSLGSVDELDSRHLRQLKELITRIEPALVSEHLAWNSFAGRYLNDLAPIPYTDAALTHLATRISRVQDFLSRQILLENPSSYLEYRFSSYGEAEFLNELSKRSGCGILLDVNNVYVSCQNHGWNALAYLRGIDAARVAEMHLAGHSRNAAGERGILIDTHDRPVCEAVWQLYQAALRIIGKRPTLIEWDADLPSWQVLVEQAARADTYMRQNYEQAA
ncbi:DUF692 domain-containing protein [Methylomonas sp. SURF-2]|uniref:UPF0276 protein NP590_10020 n=1 Tax=Methylomonas subterranea TaxID=2952225 RepID=A0ABT1TG49_9GAMM|nr:DUF692 domain-containing protein [Methylomonas sp. SURF-2]MCQ8104438.1 DUF692 domain-containing protein [Methylomonas sp. SURF-2]